MRINLVILSALALFPIFSVCNAEKIKFYFGLNFTGEVYDKNISEECNNVPVQLAASARSIKTNVCLILYWYSDCNSVISWKLEAPGYSEIPRILYIRSLRLCDENEGGPQLNVDLTTYQALDITLFFASSHPPQIPKVLKSYKTVCTCINIPQYIQHMEKWSLDNHGNELLAYYEPYCGSDRFSPEYIHGGQNNSREIYHYKKTDNITKISYKIQSFSPHPNSTYFHKSCIGYIADDMDNPLAKSYLDKINWELAIKHKYAGGDLDSFPVLDVFEKMGEVERMPIVRMYEGYNNKGLLYEINPSHKCSNLPGNKTYLVKSIQTQTCLMVYEKPGCGMSPSRKIMSNETSVDATVGSFHACTENEGGNQLNVDLIKFKYDNNTIVVLDVLETYKNVCSCVNVPGYIQEYSDWSINNHGNELWAFFEPDCGTGKWKPLFIRGGISQGSMSLYSRERIDEETNFSYKIQSFGPHRNSTYFQSTCVYNEVVKKPVEEGPVVGEGEEGEVFEGTLENRVKILEKIQVQYVVVFHEIAKKFRVVEEKRRQGDLHLEVYERQMRTKMEELEKKLAHLEDRVELCQKNSTKVYY